MAEVNIPKIGPIKKPVVIAVGVGAVAIIGWRYWQSRSGAGADVAATSDYADDGTIPAVAGAVSSDNSYGSGQPVDNTQTSYGFHGTTNDEWVQYATTQLTQSADWSYTDIVSALGNFVTNKPVSPLQQQIVQAAIGLAGYPPVGSHTVIPVAEVPLSSAPHGITATALSTSAIHVTWSGLTGATDYDLFNGSKSIYIGPATSFTETGLNSGTTYSYTVAGRNMVGAIGPKSNTVTAATLKPIPNLPANASGNNRVTTPVTRGGPAIASGTTAIRNP